MGALDPMTNRDSRIRVLIVDDHPLLRDGIAAVIGGQPDMTVAGEAADGSEAIERYRALRPDMTLMDLQMPVLDGTGAIRVIRQEFPRARIVVLSTYAGDVEVQHALEAGASGYLLKSGPRSDVLEAIRAVHAGRRYIPSVIAVEIAEHRGDQELTDRELAVLQRVAAGRSNKVAADELGISEETVKTHMRSILAKLAASDRTHAVTIATKRGILGR
jgi:two-component system, NarL family, response regulator